MKKDYQIIIDLCKVVGVEVHETYNEKLFSTLKGNAETENIFFANIVLSTVEDFRKDEEVDAGVLDEDWYEIVQDFREMTQVFAQVNDIVVEDWNGMGEKVVEAYLKCKIKQDTLTINK